MAGFNEDTRVKVPALMHLTRIGYTYRSLHSLHLDPMYHGACPHDICILNNVYFLK